MSEILKVLNKSVELKSEVVEFSLTGDLSKSLSLIRKESTQLDNQIDKFFNEVYSARETGLKVNGTSYLKSVKESKEILKKVESLASELGVKPTDIDGYTDLKSYVFQSKDMEDNYKYARKIVNGLKL